MATHASRRALVMVIGPVFLAAAGCAGDAPSTRQPAAGAFGGDLDFLRAHTEIVLLANQDGAQVAVAPTYQGRVMTSTTGGADAPSFGWIGQAAVSAGTRQPHMNVFGGEDRFWLGPEGGQFALYFQPGDPFDLDHWQTPAAFDWDTWEVAGRTDVEVRFHKSMALVNYARTPFAIDVDRTVRLLDAREAAARLGTDPGASVRTVAFESENTITNTGKAAWQAASGLVSVWILGQFNPTPATTIVIPYAPGPETALGPIVNDAYFGKVPADRLAVEDAAIFFRADGRYRSKIGLSPARARAVAGSYDAAARVLTLVQFTRQEGATEYVNSMWEIQKEPYKGDAINSYNDGPPAPGQPPLGPFYELETSSPALSLVPGGRYTHVHRTFHLTGPEVELDRIARGTLGVGLAEIARALPK